MHHRSPPLIQPVRVSDARRPGNHYPSHPARLSMMIGQTHLLPRKPPLPCFPSRWQMPHSARYRSTKPVLPGRQTTGEPIRVRVQKHRSAVGLPVNSHPARSGIRRRLWLPGFPWRHQNFPERRSDPAFYTGRVYQNILRVCLEFHRCFSMRIACDHQAPWL